MSSNVTVTVSFDLVTEEIPVPSLPFVKLCTLTRVVATPSWFRAVIVNTIEALEAELAIPRAGANLRVSLETPNVSVEAFPTVIPEGAAETLKLLGPVP